MFSEIVLAVCLLVFCRWYFRRWERITLLEKIPGPAGLPLVGNLMSISGGPEDAFRGFNSLAKFGDGLVKFYVGTMPYAMVYRAGSVEQLLANNSALRKSRHYRFVKVLVNTGVLTAEGEKWKQRRRLLTPAFHFKILDDFIEVFNKHAKVLTTKLDRLAEEGGAVDIHGLLSLCTLDIIMDTSMGWELNAQGDKSCSYIQALKKLLAIIQMRGSKPWLGSDKIFNLLGYGKIQEDLLKVLHGQSEAAIQRRKKIYFAERGKENNESSGNNNGKFSGDTTKRRLAFLDLMLEEAAQNSIAMSDKDLREEVDTFMFAGHDTTSTATTFNLHFLATHQEIQQRLYEEISEVVPHDSDIRKEHLTDLRYLDACIKESLRIAPAVPIVSRENIKDIVIDGYTVPARTTFLVNIYALHRDPKYFPEPEAYRPERFLEGRSWHPYAYTPFSAGARNCIGQRFAMLVQKVLLCQVVRRYALTTGQRYADLQLSAKVTLEAKGGIRLNLRRRNLGGSP